MDRTSFTVSGRPFDRRISLSTSASVADLDVDNLLNEITNAMRAAVRNQMDGVRQEMREIQDFRE
ncbi:hypothetical protein HDV00_006866 [Rhizophlyctis rosea]|nr:hypothetical protein HDV00_006866 [Rhizophlyctis rosea]